MTRVSSVEFINNGSKITGDAEGKFYIYSNMT